MKNEDEIRKRIDDLDARHCKFSERTRMSIEGMQLVLRMSELQWVLEE